MPSRLLLVSNFVEFIELVIVILSFKIHYVKLLSDEKMNEKFYGTVCDS